MDLSRPLSGAVLGRLAAPDITPVGLASRGWTAGALRGFLAGGIAAEGSAFGDMHPVIMLSTRHLTTEDLDAAVTYLLGDSPPDPPGLPSVPDPTTAGSPAADPGRATYVALCAGCHALDGSGIPNTVVALGGNSTLRSADPRNLVVAIFDGIAAQDFPGLASMQPMPGFAGKLTDGDAAGLANYLRATWGGQAPDVTPAVAEALR